MIKQLHCQIILVILLFPFLQIQSQISSGGTPPSFEQVNLSEEVPVVSMPVFDLEAMLDEDEQFYSQKGQMIRFGKEFPVNIQLETHGIWETLENGDRIWRLAIYSKKAVSISLLYEHFELPEGASFFLYNEDASQQLGAFTAFNNKPHKQFSTGFIKAPLCYLEYYEPAAVEGEGKIHISTVVHGYRNYGKVKGTSNQRDFQDSGNCNNNVNCPEGGPWLQEINSVGMITLGGFRLCSGAMINNQRQDCTPYFLTADHCLGSNTNQWLIIFNYESPTCQNIDGPTNQSISGATVKASWEDSDFALLELSTPIPPDYNIYLAGYNAVNFPASSVTSVHHPSGDIKKITFDEDGVFSASFTGLSPNSHWEVSEWEDGTTEGGSSGSPLFDQDHYLIGQLSGGNASCLNDDEYDSYGKLAANWEGGETASSRIRDYLDPDNTGTLVLQGRYCSEPDFELDAAISGLGGVSGSLCTSKISPSLNFSNLGSETITSLELAYSVNGDNIGVYEWSGQLAYLSNIIIELPEFDLETGSHDFEVIVLSVNGSETDENSENNFASSTVEVVVGLEMIIEISTDNWGEENTLSLTNAAGEQLFFQEEFNSNATTTESLCVEEGCFVFEIIDSYGDGLNNDSETTSDDGSFTIEAIGEIFVEGGGYFGDCEPVTNPDPCSAIYEFCVLLDPTSLVPQFEVENSIFCTGQSIQFSDLSIGDPTEWNWDFGGMGSSDESNPSFTFENPGSYEVVLTVDNGTEVAETSTTVLVNAVPNAVFSFSNYDLSVELALENLNSDDLIFQWNFGDGETSLEAEPTHTYEEAGEYELCVLVGNNGCIAQHCEFVEVNCGPFSANFTFNQDNFLVDFQAGMLTGADWSWDFGDGNVSNETHPENLYAAEGNYNVCLTITDVCGQEVENCEEIQIMNTGINELTEINSIIYPNPSTGNFTLEVAQGQAEAWKVVNAAGQIVKEGKFLNSGSWSIDLSEQTAGIYFLYLFNKKSEQVSKLIRY